MGWNCERARRAATGRGGSASTFEIILLIQVGIIALAPLAGAVK